MSMEVGDRMRESIVEVEKLLCGSQPEADNQHAAECETCKQWKSRALRIETVNHTAEQFSEQEHISELKSASSKGSTTKTIHTKTISHGSPEYGRNHMDTSNKGTRDSKNQQRSMGTKLYSKTKSFANIMSILRGSSSKGEEPEITGGEQAEEPLSQSSTEPNRANNKQMSRQEIIKAIETGVFSDCIDRNTSERIFNIRKFRDFVPDFLSNEDFTRLLHSHPQPLLRSLGQLLTDDETSVRQYRTEYEELADKLGGILNRPTMHPSDHKTRTDYQDLITGLMVCVNKGNLECDQRFLRIVNRTIKKIGVYDDPALSKMTIQFVLCKNYLEDYIRIKELMKEFSHCNI